MRDWPFCPFQESKQQLLLVNIGFLDPLFHALTKPFTKVTILFYFCGEALATDWPLLTN
jgi:hypothetical protein